MSLTMQDLQSTKVAERLAAQKKRVSMIDTVSEERSSSAGLFPLYSGASGALVFVLASPLDNFPQRRTDGAYAVPRSQVKRELAAKGPTKKIRRVTGIETQIRSVCPDSGIRLAYRCAPWSDATKHSDVLYVHREMLVNDPDEVAVSMDDDDDEGAGDASESGGGANPANDSDTSNGATTGKRARGMPQVPSYFKQTGSTVTTEEDGAEQQTQVGTRVTVHQVAFNCTTSRFVRLGTDALEVELASPPEEAKANVALMSLFSLACGVPAYDLSVAWCEGKDRVLLSAHGVRPAQLLDAVQGAMEG